MISRWCGPEPKNISKLFQYPAETLQTIIGPKTWQKALEQKNMFGKIILTQPL